jgi:hypothetical protein
VSGLILNNKSKLCHSTNATFYQDKAFPTKKSQEMGKDRTNEFFTCVESYASRMDHTSTQLLSPGPKTRSEFTKAASIISKQINDTVQRLGKLTELAKKKSMFEDKPVEINELIYIIKQDLAKVNHQIGTRLLILFTFRYSY